MKKCLLVVFILLLSLTGCRKESVPVTEPVVETTSVQTEPTIPETTEPTTIPTTEPDLSLHVDAGDHVDTYTDSTTGDYLEYCMTIPENAVKGMPLVVYLHGDGSTGRIDAVRNNALIARAKQVYGPEFPFLILSPCTRVQSWINGTIPGTLKGLIDYISQEYEVNSEHIIITGFSRGSIGVWYMISAYGDYFSAAVPVSCGNDSTLDYENCCEVPVWGFAGNGEYNESAYYYAMRYIVEKMVESGGTAQLTLLNGKTHRETPAIAYSLETFEWMLAQ